MRNLFLIILLIVSINYVFAQKKRGTKINEHHLKAFSSIGYIAINNSNNINKYFQYRNGILLQGGLLFKRSKIHFNMVSSINTAKIDYEYETVFDENEKFIHSIWSFGYGYYLVDKKMRIYPYVNFGNSSFRSTIGESNRAKFKTIIYDIGIRPEFVVFSKSEATVKSEPFDIYVYGQFGCIYENFNDRLNGMNYYFAIGIGSLVSTYSR